MTNLKIHFKMFHEEQKNFQCDFCEKFLPLKQNLKIYIKNVHEGMRNTSQNTIVIIVKNSSLNWENGRNTSRKFILNRNTNLIFHLKFYPIIFQ